MLKIGNKYSFKVVRKISERQLAEIECPFGGRYKLPDFFDDEFIELVVVNKHSGRLIFSQETCAKTKYKLNDEVVLPICEVEETNDVNRVKLHVKDSIGRIFDFPVPKLVYEKVRETNAIKCRVINILGDKLFLRNAERMHFDYSPSQVYKLEVIKMQEAKKSDKTIYSIICKGLYGEPISVVARKWQFYHQTKINFVFVKIDVERGNGFTQDFGNVSHPFFEIGKEYEFVFLKSDIERADRVIIQGEDGCTYLSYAPFNVDASSIKALAKIRYIFIGLRADNGNPKLKTFIQFEDIIKNYRALKRLTFDSIYKDKNSTDELVMKFISDYDDFQNLWVISFCEILRQKIQEGISNGDFDSSLIFIDVLVQTEKWILESGFLTTFTETKRIETAKMAASEIAKFSKLAKALEILIDKKDALYIDSLVDCLIKGKLDEFNRDIDLVVQIFWYQQIHSEVDFERLFKLIYHIGIKQEDFFSRETSVNELIVLLERIRSEFDKMLLTRVFISSKERNSFFHNNINIRHFIQTNLVLAKVFVINSEFEDLHLSVSRIFKLYSFYTPDYNDQLRSISISIKLLQAEYGKVLKGDFLSLMWEHILDIDLFIKTNVSITLQNKPLDQLSLLQSSMISQAVLKGQVVGKNEIGYLVAFDSDTLILPYYITNRIFFTNEEIEFVVKSIDEKFANVIVAENRRLIGDEIITNIDEVKEGDIVKGRVKQIESKFVWINLGLVDGRMPIHEISKQFVQHPSAILKIGQVIEVKIISIEEKDGKKFCKLSRKAVLEEKTKSIASQDGKEFVATITSVDNYHGLLVELDYGDSCIIPRKNISWNPIFNLNEIFDIGEKINVKIIGFAGNGHLKASALTSSDPFTDTSSIDSKEFDAKIFAVYGFDYWMTKYEMNQNETEDDDYFYCPKCSKYSKYKLSNLGFAYSSKKTLKVDKKSGCWSCTYCNWQGEDIIMLWLPQISCTAAFRFGNRERDRKDSLLQKIEHGDYCRVRSLKLNRNNGYIYVDIVPETLKHKPRIIFNTNYNQLLLQEIANCYEHFAFLSNDYKERINYLNFSRYYYGAAHNAKSYYLKAYVEFTDIVYSFESKKISSEDPVIIDKVTKLITQIESEGLSVEVFPIIENIIKILKILRLYKTDSKDDMFFLFENSIAADNSISSISSLSKILLAQSLLVKEESAILDENLNSKIINKLRETLTLFEYIEVEEEDYLRQKLIYRLMQKGENIDVEFKASLDVPVLNKITKKEIIRLQREMIKANQVNDVKELHEIQSRIESLNRIDFNSKLLIKEINLSAIKTLAAFANTSGGYLVIGVDEDENDSPYILGLRLDLEKHKNKDNMKLRFDHLVQNYLGDSFNQHIEEFNFITLGDKEVLLIKVGVSENEPVFLTKADADTVFFIRRQASTVSLPTAEQYKYFMKRFRH